ncbi:hypothetical protein E0Z10_g10759 [Xylaria hypoxylon]|uniref:Carrier domain-containing protein n=1 Tax=Xylaria hypoxylon TaxID=37992 RepID=A0A4Z0YE63_9PEZI|nr:hypothetical protein E0Z10_g10759 [Xylaria hypoxylon]
MAHHEEPKLLPNAIDQIAAEEPESLYGKYPSDPTNYTAGFINVTFAQLANATNGVAWWLENEIGCGDEDPTPTIAYIGPNDFRYVFAFVGAIKAGYKLFLPSPRNSLAAHLALLESLDCTRIIVAGPTSPTVDDVLKERPMRLLEIASMEHLINYPSEPYPYPKAPNKAMRDGAFVCHTSGTTGIPKHCIYNHEFIIRSARTLSLPPPEGYTSLMSKLGSNTQVLVLPFFHPAGVQLGIINAIYNRSIVVIPSWTTPPSTDGLTTLVQNVQADWAMTTPFTLEALAKDAALLDRVASRLTMLVFAGGALPKALGDVIAKKIRLASFLGSSETAGLPIIYPQDFDLSKDWEYMGFHPKVGVVHHARTEDMFELVLEKSTSTEPYQPVFDRFPELETFPTGDLFRRHPFNQDMWAHASRADDIVVFLNGEKTNPVSFENHLSQHPDIEGAIVFGDQRFEAGVLIELRIGSTLSSEQRDERVRNLWPTIEEANQDTPKHARVAASHILFATPDVSLLRTPKGTIMRKASIGRYAQAIDDLYQIVESAPPADTGRKVNIDDLEAVVVAIQLACKESTTLREFGREDNLLSRGMDSLQVLRLCRNLRFSIGIDNLKPTTVYSNPTPITLAKAIQIAVRGQGSLEEESKDDRKLQLKETLALFTRRIDQLAGNRPQAPGKKHRTGDGHSCIVTGTTGSIGSYILHSLMKDKNITTIYCLNRGPDSATRQRNHNAEVDHQLPTTFPETVHFLQVDLTHVTFNLSQELFEQLSSSVTLIVHNAWSVDFNVPLSLFTENLVGVENLCKFSAQSLHRPAIVFLSSISAVMDLALRQDQVVPEGVLDDLSVPAAVGYGESKYLAERILAYAAEKLEIPIAVARIGQVCGATHSPGKWNPSEWIPRLIKGSASLGALPDSLGDYGADVKDVDWIPVDMVADAIVELLLKKWVASRHEQHTDVRVYHLLNLQRTSWAEILPVVVNTLSSLKSQDGNKASVDVVSCQEWLKSLRSLANDIDAIHHGNDLTDVNPALRLIDFYEDKFAEKVFPQWGTENAASTITILQQVGSISDGDMEKWIRLWWQDGVGS